MKVFGILSAVILVLGQPLLAADGTKFTVDVSGLFLTRAAGSTSPLVSLYENAGTGDVFTTRNVALDSWKTGCDLRLRYARGKFGVEIRGFLLGRQSNSPVFAATETTILAIETNPSVGYYMYSGDTLTAINRSKALKGFEANLTYDFTPMVRLYAGVRHLRADDSFDLYGDFSGSNYEDDQWTATNKMLGVQIGARIEFFRPAGDETALGLTAQGRGAFVLFGRDSRVVFGMTTAYGSFYDDVVADAPHKLTPGVDAGLQIGYRVSRIIEVHIGYDLLWVNSVSQASRQVTGMTPYITRPTLTLVYNSLLVHGARAGMTVRF